MTDVFITYTFYGTASNGKAIEVFRVTKTGKAASQRHETVATYALGNKGWREAMAETGRRNRHIGA
jgi:hypothetical protein